MNYFYIYIYIALPPLCLILVPRPDTEYDNNNGGYYSLFIADNATTTNYLGMHWSLNIFARQGDVRISDVQQMNFWRQNTVRSISVDQCRPCRCWRFLISVSLTMITDIIYREITPVLFSPLV